MPVTPFASQAFNSVMPTNGVAGGGMGAPMMPPNVGMGGQISDLAGARPLNRGGVAQSPIKMTTGPLVSDVPGRTDKHFTHVPSGSFVIPADIVSGHGEGNTLAGMNTLQKLFKMGAHATSQPHKMGSINRVKKFSAGGTTDLNVGKPVPVKLAGGEIVVPPENAHETMQRIHGKKMSLDEAHAAMDKWVVNERKKLRQTLAKLPGPAKD